MEMETRARDRNLIAIIGTGDLGCALARRLMCSGYDVVLGSRCPSRRKFNGSRPIPDGVQFTSVERCLENSDVHVLFLALQYRHMVPLLTPYKDLLDGKVLVDVSNRSRKLSGDRPSNAEVLAKHFPSARIVKGLNTLLPDVLEGLSSDATSRTTVYLAGSHVEAVDIVSRLVRRMGFSPICRGDLRTARDIEALPHTFMKGWAVPTCIACGVVLVWLSVLVYDEILKHRMSSLQGYHWQRVPLDLLNVLLALSAVSLLALTYFPGCLAALVQLCYGTKYKPFPSWLDRWLKSRKVLGLTALLFTYWHVAISLILVSPSTMPFLYSTAASSSYSASSSSNNNNIQNSSQRHNNNNDSNNNNYSNNNNHNNRYQHRHQLLTVPSSAGLSVGILSLVALSVVGIATLPSVGSRLNWREWRFFQSHVGHASLFLAAAHITLLFSPYWHALGTTFYTEKSFLCCLTPFLVLFLKLLLSVPPIHRRVDAIRGGWVHKHNPPKVTVEEMELL